MTKKVVLYLHIHDNKEKQKAMKAISSVSGLESVAMDMKEKKLTVIGDVDPVQIVSKLRKFWHTEILTVGPAKEPEKKEKKEDEKKKETEQLVADLITNTINGNYNRNPTPTPYHSAADDDPNSCVIC